MQTSDRHKLMTRGTLTLLIVALGLAGCITQEDIKIQNDMAQDRIARTMAERCDMTKTKPYEPSAPPRPGMQRTGYRLTCIDTSGASLVLIFDGAGYLDRVYTIK